VRAFIAPNQANTLYYARISPPGITDRILAAGATIPTKPHISEHKDGFRQLQAAEPTQFVSMREIAKEEARRASRCGPESAPVRPHDLRLRLGASSGISA
jgi:hypothetical protein